MKKHINTLLFFLLCSQGLSYGSLHEQECLSNSAYLSAEVADSSEKTEEEVNLLDLLLDDSLIDAVSEHKELSVADQIELGLLLLRIKTEQGITALKSNPLGIISSLSKSFSRFLKEDVITHAETHKERYLLFSLVK